MFCSLLRSRETLQRKPSRYTSNFREISIKDSAEVRYFEVFLNNFKPIIIEKAPLESINTGGDEECGNKESGDGKDAREHISAYARYIYDCAH